MDSNQAVIAAAMMALDPEMPVAQAEHAARLTAAALDHTGHVLVKMPEQEADGIGQACWLVDTGRAYDNASVTMQTGAGWERLALDGVGTPITSPDAAESLAAALLAGARKMRERA